MKMKTMKAEVHFARLGIVQTTMTDPKLELKSVKVHQAMSEETLCFSATIYVDGKQAGAVTNRGHGGCHEYRWTDKATGERLKAWAEAQNLPIDLEQLDQIIYNLVSLTEVEKRLKRLCSKKTLYRIRGDKSGWRTHPGPFTESLRLQMVEKLGDKLECIANEDVHKAAQIDIQGVLDSQGAS